MIAAQVNVPFEAIATGASPGLAGVITVEIYDPSDGTSVLSPTTDGISEPRPGTYRVELTVATAGTFSVRWATDDGVAEEPVSVTEGALPPVGEVVPTSDDVAALLRARTKDLDGNELGIFNANTRPTNDEVEHLITLAYAEVTAQTGATLGARCMDAARALIAIRAAAWVELSYFPEQVRSDRSVYRELADQWTAGMPALIACVEGNAPGAGEDGSTAGYRFGVLDVHGWTASPYYGVPAEPAPDPGDVLP